MHGASHCAALVHHPDGTCQLVVLTDGAAASSSSMVDAGAPLLLELWEGVSFLTCQFSCQTVDIDLDFHIQLHNARGFLHSLPGSGSGYQVIAAECGFLLFLLCHGCRRPMATGAVGKAGLPVVFFINY